MPVPPETPPVFVGIGRVGTRLVVQRPGGRQVVDLATIASVEEREFVVHLRDDAGRAATLELSSPAARPDVLARVIEWCSPVIHRETDRVVAQGVEVRAPAPPVSRESTALFLELAAVGLVALVAKNIVITMLAAAYAFVRVPIRLRRASALAPPIRLLPSGERLFPRLVEGNVEIELSHAVFDPGEWAMGRAVVTDGTRSIAVPLGERPGAFALFAALVTWCGTPDDRIVD
ncbi:MAG: hypothetical protein JNJ88_00675 [Planctomycetes bacterium]|nr:hypothetical protein [Planctomycetota bacterium]